MQWENGSLDYALWLAARFRRFILTVAPNGNTVTVFKTASHADFVKHWLLHDTGQAIIFLTYGPPEEILTIAGIKKRRVHTEECRNICVENQ